MRQDGSAKKVSARCKPGVKWRSTVLIFATGFFCGRYSAAFNALGLDVFVNFSDEPRQIDMQATSSMKETTTNSASDKLSTTDLPTRTVTVGSMCRCSSGNMPFQYNHSSHIDDTSIIQEASSATGDSKKHFFMRKSLCECQKGQGEETNDQYLEIIQKKARGTKPKPGSKYKYSYCSNRLPSNMVWAAMPDFGVEENLPLFLGVLSYKSPLSLNASLENWKTHGLKGLDFAGSFVQLNERSKLDDEVIARHDQAFNFTVTGTSEENIHPGLAISRFCRAAAKMPNSHPHGENLILFLEKDWHLMEARQDLKGIFRSVNSLVQRGVPYVRLSPNASYTDKSWQCDAEGIKWTCQTAHQHRYTNLPSVVRCDWFLRYLEPFALVEDSIMYGCRRGFQRKRYFDWEEAMQDGRIAWTNSQWVIASFKEYMFKHVV
jgi:hypothetical protein